MLRFREVDGGGWESYRENKIKPVFQPEEALTEEQLRQLAFEHNVDVSKAKTKAAIIKLLNATTEM